MTDFFFFAKTDGYSDLKNQILSFCVTKLSREVFVLSLENRLWI